MQKLLIQVCSQLKSAAIGEIPAFDRYQGFSFKIIKKFLRENPRVRGELKIIILSAKYGLISSEDLIADYDRRMDKKRALELKEEVFACWEKLWR